MISKDDVEKLHTFAAAGRGLWIGLLVNHEQVKGHPFDVLMPEDAHVTLAHLGKRCTPEQVDLVCSWMNTMEIDRPWPRVLKAQLTGHGRLWRYSGEATPVALVNSAALCDMRSYLARVMEDLVDYKDKYGFIPHVTVKKNGMNCNTLRPLDISFDNLYLVCGEAKVPVL